MVQVNNKIGLIYAFLSITPLILNLEPITLYPTRIVCPMLGDTCCSPKTVIVETKTDLKVLQCVHPADGGRHVDTLVPSVVVVVPDVAVGGLTALLVRLQVVNDLCTRDRGGNSDILPCSYTGKDMSFQHGQVQSDIPFFKENIAYLY